MPPAPKPRRSSVALSPEARQLLEKRGARSDRARGPYNYSHQLTRTVLLYDTTHIKSDPRETQRLRDEDYEFVLDLLTQPLELDAFDIGELGDYLFALPAFPARASERRINPDRFREMLNRYSFAEKLHLVDAAILRHAPPRPPRTKASP